MYPLNVSLPAPGIGYAVANGEAEHAALTDAGYEPKLVAAADEPPADPGESDNQGHTVASVRVALDNLGIPYSNRLGLAKLVALLPAA